jgi:hypothetical protein
LKQNRIKLSRIFSALFWADWQVEPKWNLCDAPGGDNGGKVDAVKKFLDSDAKVLVCTHATFRFAVDKFGVEVLDDRRIAVDEFHHVSANPDNKLGDHAGCFSIGSPHGIYCAVVAGSRSVD